MEDGRNKPHDRKVSYNEKIQRRTPDREKKLAQKDVD